MEKNVRAKEDEMSPSISTQHFDKKKKEKRGEKERTFNARRILAKQSNLLCAVH